MPLSSLVSPVKLIPPHWPRNESMSDELSIRKGGQAYLAPHRGSSMDQRRQRNSECHKPDCEHGEASARARRWQTSKMKYEQSILISLARRSPTSRGITSHHATAYHDSGKPFANSCAIQHNLVNALRGYMFIPAVSCNGRHSRHSPQEALRSRRTEP